jgi:hypothetical protein
VYVSGRSSRVFINRHVACLLSLSLVARSASLSLVARSASLSLVARSASLSSVARSASLLRGRFTIQYPMFVGSVEFTIPCPPCCKWINVNCFLTFSKRVLIISMITTFELVINNELELCEVAIILIMFP